MLGETGEGIELIKKRAWKGKYIGGWDETLPGIDFGFSFSFLFIFYVYF